MFIPLNVQTHYSFLKGFAKPKELYEKCQEYNYAGCAIADYNSVSGVVAFYKTFKDIKPLIASRIRCTQLGYINLYAINIDGWKELINIINMMAIKDEDQIEWTHLMDIKNCILILGGLYSEIDTKVIENLKIHFGEKFFIGLDRINEKESAWENVADKINAKTVAMPSILYANEIDRFDQLTLFSSEIGITSSDWTTCSNNEFLTYSQQKLFLPNNLSAFKQSEIDNTKVVMDMCDKFSVLDKPRMPTFECPNGMTDKDYLLHLCREGWKKLSPKLDSSRREEYAERVKVELQVIQKANLDNYFLIVQDYVNWAKNKGWLIGCGRGSAGGSLVSYLTGIISIDPIKYNLLFERFYNDGRNTIDKISLPDIDTDFPISNREEVIDYIRSRYGSDKVAQVVTYASLQGRGAVKEVFRIHNVCDQKTADKITKNIPQKDKISDKLEEEKEDSVVRWTLNNEPTALKTWCEIDNNGNLTGEYAEYFAQAIRLEKTYKGYGKHASAIVLGYKPIKEICPMIREKKGDELLANVPYVDLEDMGVPKMDILGVAVLDKLMYGNELLKGNV